MTPIQPVAGFDVGQTSTTCALVDHTGRVLGSGHGPGVIHLSAEGGGPRFVQAVDTALHDALAGIASPSPHAAAPGAAVLGATGVMDRDSAEAQLATRLVQEIMPDAEILVVSDAETALFGAHGGGPGAIVIAGTGSIALAQDVRGQPARAGGWGWLIDDAGSAFAIGQAGLQAAVRGAEGSGPATELTHRMRVHFQIHDLYEVKYRVYAPDFGARGFAALAAHVSDAAQAGDTVALAVIGDAAQNLARLILAVVRRLPVEGRDSFPVACLGGAFTHISGLYDRFVAALADQAGNLQPRAPLLPPDFGAALMALQFQGSDIAGALPRLRAAVPEQ